MRRPALRGMAVAVLSAALAGRSVAQTDGMVTCRYTTVTYGGTYSPRHVLASWVTDSSGAFVRTLEKRAAARQQYLYTWIAASAYSTNVDTITGATLSGHRGHTNVWNCRNASGALVPDGTYRIRVEFTEANAQGRVTATNYIQFTKGATAFATNYVNLTNFTSISVAYAPLPETHDISVVRVSPPAIVNPGVFANVPVVVSNRGALAETFVLVLSNETARAEVGRATVAGLAGRAAATNTFSWDTTGLAPGVHTLRASAGPVTNETDLSNNALSATTTVRDPFHDVAVPALSAPPVIAPGATSNLTVTVTNRGDYAESFSVVVTDRTDRVAVGTRTLSGLGAYRGTNLVIAWNTTGRSQGYHELAAIAEVVAGDAQPANNTNTAMVAIASGISTNSLVPRRATWRYHDRGLNLHGGPWTGADYYDGHWAAGAGPLGYGRAWIETTLSYGTNANLKHPCYYFRREFTLDVLPSSVTGRLMFDDGAVVYLNGREAYRTNLPAGAIAYTNYALGSRTGSAESSYVAFAVSPSALAVGRNVVAAEIHQASASSTDLGFDLQLEAVVPNLQLVHDVAVSALHPRGTVVQGGERLEVDVRVANLGRATESFTVALADTNSGSTVASAAVAALVPGDSRDLLLAWDTVGAAAGAHGLRAAIAPLAGETNTADNAALAVVSVAPSGFGPAALSAVGSIGGFCSAVALSGSRAYVGEGATLAVYDVGTPGSPARRGSCRLPGAIEALAVDGNWVYAAAGASGVHFVDATVPTNPVCRRTFETSGHARGLAVAGSRLYVADGVAGLRIVDVTAPASAWLLGSYPTRGPARAVAVAGTKAYVLDQHDGLLVVNAATPSAPALLGRCGGVSSGEGLALSGTVAVTADGERMLRIVNVANPAAPVVAGSLLLDGPASSLALAGPTAWVALGAAGVQAVNVANPASPASLGTTDTPGEAVAVALAGATAFVADGFGGLRVLDVTAPAAPALLATAGAGLRARDAVAAGDLLYVAAGERGIEIFNTADPAAPGLAGAYATPSNALAVALGTGRLLVADGQYGLRVAELATPTTAVHRATYAPAGLGPVRSVAARGTRAVLTDGAELHLLDLADPASPSRLGSDRPASTDHRCFVHDLAFAGTLVVAAAGEAGLRVYDGDTLALRGTLDTAGSAVGVDGGSNVVYVADGAGGWLVVDLADPAVPALASAHTERGPAVDVAVAARFAQVATAGQGVRALDAAAPLTPVERTSFAPLAQALKVAAQGTVAFVSQDAAGVTVLDLSPGDHNLNGLPDTLDRQIVDADPSDAIASADDVRPGDDFDGDGFSNLQESIAGTDPTDPRSYFMVSSQTGAAPGGGFAVRWQSVVGRTYAVYRSTNLVAGAGFVPLATGIPGVGGVQTYTDAAPPPQAYYMVEVE